MGGETTAMAIEVRDVAPEDPDAAALLAAQEAELDARYGGGDLNPVAPGAFVAFVLVTDDGRPVACGGLRRFDTETAEIKRMYTVPEARGQGLGRRVLRALEDRARALGYATLLPGDRSAPARGDRPLPAGRIRADPLLPAI